MGWDNSFAERADSGRLNIGIIGLGYVGLPTAIGFRDAGFNVWGVDLSERIVNALHEGKNPLGDPDLDDMIPIPGSDGWSITTNTQEATKECDYMDQPISFVSVPNSSVVSVPNSTSVTHRYTFPETVNVTVDQPSFSRDPIPLNGNRTESWKILASDAYGNTLTNTNNIENTYSHLSKGFSLEAKPFTPSSSLSVPPTPPMFPKSSPDVLESEAMTLENRSSFFERLTSYAITEVKEQKIRD